eukprot:XP_001693624.1 inositol acyltransferase [Chlamydomonas reinhardtii]
MDRKAAKEAFVSGLSGASKAEVFALVASLSLSIVICELAKTGLRSKSWWSSVLLELVLVVYLQLLLCTGALPLAPTAWTCAALAAASTAWRLLATAQSAHHPLHSSPQGSQAALQALAGKRKGFISAFRGALMIATCIAILAVDFHVFPRRYAKTETYGTGYMDVGVGGVVLAAGLVSPVATSGNDGTPWKPAPLLQRIWAGLRGAAVCWVLGLARLATTRAVDYQEHVGEYGGLGAWVMSHERDPSSLISLNKEGLVSAPGFYALFLSCNAAYVLWIAAQLLAGVLPLALAQAAVNSAQLPVFLVANLLTGAVNLSVDTMQVPDWPARAVLGGYISTVCAVAVVLQRWGLRLKL